MIKLPVDLSDVPPYMIKVSIILIMIVVSEKNKWLQFENISSLGNCFVLTKLFPIYS